MEKFEIPEPSEGQSVQRDVDREIYGQPVEYILARDEQFNEAGFAIHYQQADVMPQVGRRVGIFHQDFGAIIVGVETDPKRGYKITLKRQEIGQ